MKWQWLHKMVEEFRAGTAWNRFLTVYQNRRVHCREHPVRSIIYIGFGFLILIVGTIIALPPGVPGFFLWIPGLLMIATRLRWAAVLMDKLEVWFHRAVGLFRRKRD